MPRRIKVLSGIFSAICLLSSIFCFSGCGYTAKSLLPAHIKKIRVENFKNAIDITEEGSGTNQGYNLYKTYKPRLEQDVTKAVIDKFIFDGNLKIAMAQDADCILGGELIGFEREALRYDESDNVEQYRIAIFVKIQLKDTKLNKILWQFDRFAGSYDYYTTGAQAKSESAAINAAIDDLARRIVWQTIEVW